METDVAVHRIVRHDCQGRIGQTLTPRIDGKLRTDVVNGSHPALDPVGRRELVDHPARVGQP